MKNTLFFILVLFSTSAFAEPLKLSGTLILSIEKGTIEAELKLSNIPKIKNYYIFINSGLNIEYFRDKDDSFNYAFRKKYNEEYSYESFGYYLPDNSGKEKFLPKSLSFKYTGKFPVISDMDKASQHGDWKGNIAFNGKTLRSDGMQASWYPVLYDIDKDVRFDSVTYDIEVKCTDCKSIYLNGSSPVSGKAGKFISENPVELMLFAGDFEIEKSNGSYFLNTGLSNEQMVDFGNVISSFEKFYQEKLNLPYGDSVVFIHTTPISKNNSWLFVAYPSIVNVGHPEGGLSDLINDEKSNWFKPFIAHELAHYYFGTYRKFNSELGDMLSESFSEYISLKLTKELIGEDVFNNIVDNKLKELINAKLIPISEIKSSSGYGDRNLYFYTYAPTNWIKLEHVIGEENMWRWINKLLTVESEFTDYDFLIKTLGDVLNDRALLEVIESNYFSKITPFDSNH
ncbi:hypothetical protein LMJ53_09605 [Rheinheimera sp. UJ51]|uniref:hypothetical protein n=1 Tax=unclassified Rheinheimera TaxID=115860 RepID=UPI001E2F0945|nr:MULTISPECIES: hypothetical protein [unclassified Rheinheimera]MCC5451977.1 hypothetical protein [Rheinheimera sp. UJ51]MCF4009888.1 hypothetical protein [Rheinheimera sp. UJ63]